MKITGYTGSNGRLCHSAIPSMTRSVIVEIVCLDTSAPYTSARCAAISPVRESLRGQRDHQLVHPGQAPLPLRHDLRLERAVPVAGDLDLDRADLGQHASWRRRPLRELPPSRPAGSCLP